MFQLIAGPCVIESEEMVLSIAKQMKEITEELGIPYTFKASFDKANRTSINSFRGPGIEEGLRILQKVKDTYGLPICTDIHESWQAEIAAQIADVLLLFCADRLIYWSLQPRQGNVLISKKLSS